LPGSYVICGNFICVILPNIIEMQQLAKLQNLQVARIFHTTTPPHNNTTKKSRSMTGFSVYPNEGFAVYFLFFLRGFSHLFFAVAAAVRQTAPAAGRTSSRSSHAAGALRHQQQGSQQQRQAASGSSFSSAALFRRHEGTSTGCNSGRLSDRGTRACSC
jgi:hypothetical protein